MYWSRVMWIWRRMYLIGQWERPMWLINAPIGQGYVDLAPDVSHWPMRETNVADGMYWSRVMWIWRLMYLIDQWERSMRLMKCSYWSGLCGSGVGCISLANERGQCGWLMLLLVRVMWIWRRMYPIGQWERLLCLINAPIGQGYVDLAPDVSHWPMREAIVADGMFLLVRVLWIWRRMYLIDQWERPMWLMNAPIGPGLCGFGAAAAAGGALLPDRAGTLVESNPCGVPDCPGTV